MQRELRYGLTLLCCSCGLWPAATAADDASFVLVDDTNYYETVIAKANNATDTDTDLSQASAAIGTGLFPAEGSQTETTVSLSGAQAELAHMSSFANGADAEANGGTKWEITSPTLADGDPLDLDGTLTITNDGSIDPVNVTGDFTVYRNTTPILLVDFSGTAVTVTKHTAQGSGGQQIYYPQPTVMIPFELDEQNPGSDGEVGDEIKVVINTGGIDEDAMSYSGPSSAEFSFLIEVNASDPNP